MNCKLNSASLILLLGLSSTSLFAQFQLPSMDVQVKGGVTSLYEMRDSDFNTYSYLAPVISSELNFNISQYFSLGAFISKGFASKTEFVSDFSRTSSYPSSHQVYGLKVRVSTGRQPKFRPFGELSYGTFEMYMEKDSYRIATTSRFFGWSLGLMIRLNNKFYLVLPQVSFRIRSDQFYFEAPNYFSKESYPPIAEITGGLSYNFGKKK